MVLAGPMEYIKNSRKENRERMENIRVYINIIARIIEAAGVASIVLGTALAFIKFLLGKQGDNNIRSYKLLRQEIGKGILLGLEILVAGDIIATVVTEPTMESVLVLGVIVLIRTFLSLSIQLEIEGRLPWEKKNSPPPAV